MSEAGTTINHPPSSANRWAIAFVLLGALWAGLPSARAEDRIVTSVAIDAKTVPESAGRVSTDSLVVPTLDPRDGWKRYLMLWQHLAEHPDHSSVRRFLALPLSGSSPVKISRGRTPPPGVSWRPGRFRRLTTPLFTIDSSATVDDTRRVAEDLRRCYWLWTQAFFPLWKSAAAVTEQTAKVQSGQLSLAKARRVPPPGPMRVVLFENRDEYLSVLSKSVPGIEASTGYYDDARRTSYFYVGRDQDVRRSRRHEWTHQLFREATASKLRSRSPGRDREFWVVEGIAGYMESIHFDGGSAIIGGWDSSRLQYARYRVLAAGDSMPLEELRADGQSAAQGRDDLARWYSHAIAWTHAMMHADGNRHRERLLRILAEVYQIDLPDQPPTVSRTGDSISLERFLKLDDADVIDNPTDRPVTELCLAGCELSAHAIERLPSSESLSWLDLTGLPVSTERLKTLIGDPSKLERLSLERTPIDDQIAGLIQSSRNLQEWDATSTAIGNDAVANLPRGLTSLYLTNTRIDDGCVDGLIALPKLQVLDVQLTGISKSGLAKMRRSRPEWNLNPLVIRRTK